MSSNSSLEHSLAEIKQFIGYFTLHFFFQKRISENEEKLKEKLESIYHKLLVETEQNSGKLLLEIIRVFKEIIQQPMPANILKGALTTLSKLFDNEKIVELLKSQSKFQPSNLLQILYKQNLEQCTDSDIEEMVLLTIQRIVIQLITSFPSQIFKSETSNMNAAIKYFFSVYRKRVIQDETSSFACSTSIHMTENSRKNMVQLFQVIINLGQTKEELEIYMPIKIQLFQKFGSQVGKTFAKLESETTHPPEQIALWTEYITFLLKTIYESLVRISCTETLKAILLELIYELMEAVCVSAESTQLLIRNQAQQLFKFLLSKILTLELDLREQVEVMFTKVVLKPLELITQKIVSTKEDKKKDPSKAQGSDSEEDISQVPHLNEVVGAGELTGSPLGQTESKMFINLHTSFAVEVLMSLTPEQMAQFFLLYDCQQFSENIIQRSIYLILKLNRGQGGQDLSLCFGVLNNILLSLERYQLQIENEEEQESILRSISSIFDMLDNKQRLKSIPKLANLKPKAFNAKMNEKFEGYEPTQIAYASAKILMYSRYCDLEKIAEVIGGKDEQSKRVLEAYLSLQDFAESKIQVSLRSFLQSFRMAGIDSQVVNRIIENFGHKFQEISKTKMFENSEECYEFAYLLIVLHTVQHNKAIKQKQTIDMFQTQAGQMAPKSIGNFPEGFLQNIYDDLTNNEILAPVTRDMIQGKFGLKGVKIELKTRLARSQKGNEHPLSEQDFVASSDLMNQQLFDFDNRLGRNFVPKILQKGALKFLVSSLTSKFMQICSSSDQGKFNHLKQMEITRTFIRVNSCYQNHELVEKLLLDLHQQTNAICEIPKFDNERKIQAQQSLKDLVWQNFKSLKMAIYLIPKTTPIGSPEMREEYLDLEKSCFQAVEHKLHTNHAEEQRQLKEKAEQAAFNEPEPTKSTSLFGSIISIFQPAATAKGKKEFKDEFASETKQQSGQSEKEMQALVELKTQFLFSTHMEMISSEVGSDLLNEMLHNHGQTFSDLFSQICAFISSSGSMMTDNVPAISTIEGTQCLSYLIQLIEDETIEQMTSLSELNFIIQTEMKSLILPKSAQSCLQPSSESEEQKNDRDSSELNDATTNDSFERLSSRSDSFIDQSFSSQLINKHFKNFGSSSTTRSQQEQSIIEQVNRHMVLYLFLKTTRQSIVEKTGQDANDLIKNIQKLFQILVEDSSRNCFEEAFLCSQINNFLAPVKRQNGTKQFPLKTYQKNQKFTRLLIFLMLQTNCETSNRDEVILSLTNLLRTISEYFEWQDPVPYDQVNLCIDIIHKQKLPLDEKHTEGMNMIESILQICDTILSLIQADPIPSENTQFSKETKEDESPIILLFDQWFKVLGALLKKVLLNPYIQLNKQMQTKAFSLLKQSMLVYPFGQSSSNQEKMRVTSLFSNLIYMLNFDNINEARQSLKNSINTKENLRNSVWTREHTEAWEDEMEGFAQLCQGAIITITDIFIQYASSASATPHLKANIESYNIQKLSSLEARTISQSNKERILKKNSESEVDISDEEVKPKVTSALSNQKGKPIKPGRLSQKGLENEQKNQTDLEVFKLLWLEYLKLILHYTEEAKTLEDSGKYQESVKPLVQCVSDNTKRVMDFLLDQKILIDETSHCEDQPMLEKLNDFEQRKELYEKTKQVLDNFWEQSPSSHVTL